MDIRQFYYLDGIDDYVERTYVFNSGRFKIGDNAEFTTWQHVSVAAGRDRFWTKADAAYARNVSRQKASAELLESASVSSVTTTEETNMATTSRGRSQDRARVAGGQDHEVNYEAKKEGVPKSEVKETVKEVGNSRKKVEAKLDKK